MVHLPLKYYAAVKMTGVAFQVLMSKKYHKNIQGRKKAKGISMCVMYIHYGKESRGRGRDHHGGLQWN